MKELPDEIELSKLKTRDVDDFPRLVSLPLKNDKGSFLYYQ